MVVREVVTVQSSRLPTGMLEVSAQEVEEASSRRA